MISVSFFIMMYVELEDIMKFALALGEGRASYEKPEDNNCSAYCSGYRLLGALFICFTYIKGDVFDEEN